MDENISIYRVIWLRAAVSNHRPALIGKYFVDSAQQIGGYPKHVRTDYGTENNIVAAISRSVANDSSAQTYGTPPVNQRIEAWWLFYRRYQSQWWIYDTTLETLCQTLC